MMSKTAVQKDRFPFQLGGGLRRRLGVGGLEPPQAQA